MDVNATRLMLQRRLTLSAWGFFALAMVHLVLVLWLSSSEHNITEHTFGLLFNMGMVGWRSSEAWRHLQLRELLENPDTEIEEIDED